MFIYVMDEHSRDLLLERGYELLKQTNTNGKVWVFHNNSDLVFDDLDVLCVISDTLTF